MPFITNKSIEEVVARADIVALIGDYTTLKRSGNKWKGLSPFTVEKTPSFFVDDENKLFYCFSTGQGGNIFKFLMIRENLTFQESVEKIAQRFGISIEYEKSGSGEPERSLRGELFTLHEEICSFFEQEFWKETSEAKSVREYWKNRQFNDSTAREFRIGYLSSSIKPLVNHLLAKHFSKELLLASGIFVGTNYSDSPLNWKCRFAARLIIPIRDIQGRVIAFTARIIPGITPQTEYASSQAKYINSPETEIFKKGKTLFNIDKAKDFFSGIKGKEDLRKVSFALVEGQLDAIRCYQNGLKTVVAGQGTGVTLEQLQMLYRYSDGVNCLFDSDSAGQHAALRLIPLAFTAGIDIAFLNIPNGKDPDEFLIEHPIEELIKTRVSSIQYLCKTFFPNPENLSVIQKMQSLKDCFELIVVSDSAVFHDACLEGISRHSGLSRSSVDTEFSNFLKNKRKYQANLEGKNINLGSDNPRIGNAYIMTSEDELLLLLLKNKNVALKLVDVIHFEWIDSFSMSGKILNKIFTEILECGWDDSSNIRDFLGNDSKELGHIAYLQAQYSEVTHVVSEEEQFELVNQCISKIFLRYCKDEEARINEKMQNPNIGLDLLRKLQNQKNDLRQRKKEIPTIN